MNICVVRMCFESMVMSPFMDGDVAFSRRQRRGQDPPACNACLPDRQARAGALGPWPPIYAPRRLAISGQRRYRLTDGGGHGVSPPTSFRLSSSAFTGIAAAAARTATIRGPVIANHPDVAQPRRQPEPKVIPSWPRTQTRTSSAVTQLPSAVASIPSVPNRSLRLLPTNDLSLWSMILPLSSAMNANHSPSTFSALL